VNALKRLPPRVGGRQRRTWHLFLTVYTYNSPSGMLQSVRLRLGNISEM
jgi:hypothetical protein